MPSPESRTESLTLRRRSFSGSNRAGKFFGRRNEFPRCVACGPVSYGHVPVWQPVRLLRRQVRNGSPQNAALESDGGEGIDRVFASCPQDTGPQATQRRVLTRRFRPSNPKNRGRVRVGGQQRNPAEPQGIVWAHFGRILSGRTGWNRGR